MARENDMAVKAIMMKAPVTLSPDDTLDLANDIIYLGRVRHLPIVEDGRLVGVLSQRDLFGAAATVLLGLKGKTKKALLKSARIREVMTKPVVTIAPDTTIKEAAQKMAAKKIGCLPVLEAGSLVGLLTQTDIMRYVANQ
jgi:CBS domain-containing protein